MILPSPCPRCGEVETEITESGNSPHYGSYRCTKCNNFRGWVEKPSTIERREQIRSTIANLLDNGNLTNWEYQFLSGLKSQNKFSPKQIQTLNKIATEKGLV
jgi:hypothetical protein